MEYDTPPLWTAMAKALDDNSLPVFTFVITNSAVCDVGI